MSGMMQKQMRQRLVACRLKDPLPYMAMYPEADILTSSDHLVSTCLVVSCSGHLHLSLM